MRAIKNCIIGTIIAGLLASMLYFGYYSVSAQLSGGITACCHISEEGRRFIAEEFGDCEDMKTLIYAIEEYEKENFSYVDGDYLVQNFKFDEFMEKKTGVCWDLAAFAKCVIQVVSELKGWEVFE